MEAQVAVVGGGVMGLMTACALQRRGVDVVVLERFEVGHDRGSSHGASRIFRYLYDDPLYVEMASLALPLWRSFGDVIDMTGGIQVDDPRVLDRYRDAMHEWGVRTEIVEPSWVATDGARAMWLDQMGVIDAAKTLALARSSLGDAVVEDWVVEAIEPGLLKTSRGDVSFGSVVVAAGAWVRDFVDLPVKVTREQVMYFEGDTREMLPWVHTAHWIYGIPRDGRVKVATHHGGPVTTAEDRSFELDEAEAERVVSYVRKYLPTVSPEPVSFETCLYTNTVDESFIIERRDDIVVVSACSGHGFKFAPLIGEIAACLVTGAEPPMSPSALERLTCKETWRMR